MISESDKTRLIKAARDAARTGCHCYLSRAAGTGGNAYL